MHFNIFLLITLVTISSPFSPQFTLQSPHSSTGKNTPSSRIYSSSTTLMLQSPDSKTQKDAKRLILIRHGRTFMNEYLATPGSQWGDANFTDVFDGTKYHLYRDSPLSQKGREQAQELNTYFSSTLEGQNIIKDVELIVASPLTRALQTVELGVLPHFYDEGNESTKVPIVALPLASERVYLISDHGSSTSKLAQNFPWVDFSNEFDRDDEEWWFTVKSGEKQKIEGRDGVNGMNCMHQDDYVEWRPNRDGQKYACFGEPDDAFEQRMAALFEWLDKQEQSVICLVCHWGVLKWLVDEEFNNCQVQDIDFDRVRSKVLKSLV